MLALGSAIDLLVAGIFFVLGRSRDASRHLTLFGYAFLLQAIRQGLNLASLGHPELQSIADFCYVLSTATLVAGARLLCNRNPGHRTISVLVGIAGLWVLLAGHLDLVLPWQAIPTYFGIAGALLYTAWLFARQHRVEPSAGYAAASLIFVLWGLHVADYPFLRGVAWFAPYGFGLTTLLILSAGLLFLIIGYRREMIAADNALEAARLSTEFARRNEAQAQLHADDAQRSAEQARLSEKRLEQALSVIREGVWIWDIPNDRVDHNLTWCTMLGLDGESLSHPVQDFADRVHEDDRAQVLARLARALEHNEPYRSSHRMRRTDGSVIWVLDRGEVTDRDADGHALRMLGSMTDVTENRRLEGRLAEAMKLESLGKLTGGMAHDFNNYLGVIIGNLELLKETAPADPTLREMIDTAEAGAMRAAELTRSLLAFARRQPLAPSLCQLDARIEALVAILRGSLGAGIVVQTRLSPDSWPVLLDPSQFDSCLVNLANNARDAMPEGGTLTIELRPIAATDAPLIDEERLQGDHVMVRVSDTGIGIAPEHLRSVFEPFFTTKGAGHGTGLGLSMVYGFVKQSGGQVQIESSLGTGTSVSLYLPRAIDAPASEKPMAPAAAVRFDSSRQTILVVEDDASVRTTAAMQLRNLGYDVIEASTPEGALERLADPGVRIDLMFSDVILGSAIDGHALAQRARELRPGLPVLLTSGFHEGGGRATNPLESWGDRHPLLPKPYRREALAERVRALLPAMPQDGAPR